MFALLEATLLRVCICVWAKVWLCNCCNIFHEFRVTQCFCLHRITYIPSWLNSLTLSRVSSSLSSFLWLWVCLRVFVHYFFFKVHICMQRVWDTFDLHTAVYPLIWAIVVVFPSLFFCSLIPLAAGKNVQITPQHTTYIN